VQASSGGSLILTAEICHITKIIGQLAGKFNRKRRGSQYPAECHEPEEVMKTYGRKD